MGSIPGSGRSPGGGHGNSPQYSCLENPMDRGAWRATVRRIVKSRTGLKRLSTQACTQSLTTPQSRTVLQEKKKNLQSLGAEVWPAFRSSNRWFPNEIVTQIPCMPENRWAAYRGLPPGILGKPIHRGGGGAAKCLPIGRLQMNKAWQPSLPLKRKELAVFGAGPLSLGQNKTKQNPKPPFQPLLPMSFQLRTTASFKFHLSFETICGNSDHWHFYFYLSDWEGLSLFQTILLKRVELTPSAAGRMVTSEGRGWGQGTGDVGGVGCFGKDRAGANPSLSQALLHRSRSLHSLSSQDLQKPWLIQSAHLFSPKHSAVHSSIKRGWNSKLLEEHWFLLLPKISFFSPLALALSFWHWVP